MKFNSNFLNVIFFASQGTWQPEEHPKGSLNLIDQVEKEKEKRRKRKELKTKTMMTWDICNAIFVKREALRTHIN